MVMLRRPLLLAFLMLPALAACGGAGGGGSSLAPPLTVGGQAAPQAARYGSDRALGRAVVRATLSSAGPALLKRKLRRAPLHSTFAAKFDHYLVNGTLYPGDAGAYPVTNTETVAATPGKPLSVAMSFSNVPVHSNEWAVLDFTGVAKDGSEIALGELGGLVNVPTSSLKTPVLTLQTTQTFQVFATLLSAGMLSTFDLDNSPTLETTLRNAIASSGIKPDPTTLLFTQGQLTKLYGMIAPRFERKLSVQTSAAGTLVLLRDYTNVSELNLAAEQGELDSSLERYVQVPKVGRVFGGDFCGNLNVYPPAEAPPKMAVVPRYVYYCDSSILSGHAVLSNVYGGHVLLGATNNPLPAGSPAPPFVSGFTAVGGRGPATTKQVTIPTGQAQATFAVNDPAGFAFASAALPTFEIVTNFGQKPLSVTGWSSDYSSPFSRVYVPANYSAVNNTIVAELFNPFDINPGNMQICGGINCYGLLSNGTLRFTRPFTDVGTNLTYFNWKPGGVATAIAPHGGGFGYDITVSGPGKVTLTTKTRSALMPRQSLYINSSLNGGSPWTLSAKDGAGRSYSDTSSGGYYADIEMDAIGNTIVTKSIQLSFDVSAAGTVTMYTIECNYNCGY